MKTVEIVAYVIVITLAWLFIGWLFTALKINYWYKILIKKGRANEYHEVIETPFTVCLPIFLIWPMQAVSWLFTDYQKNNRQKEIMPITPLGGQFITTSGNGSVVRSNINYAIIFNKSEYYSSYNYPSEQINKSDYMKWQFGSGVLSGGFHFCFSGLSESCWWR